MFDGGSHLGFQVDNIHFYFTSFKFVSPDKTESDIIEVPLL